jgi:hypothetical protein
MQKFMERLAISHRSFFPLNGVPQKKQKLKDKTANMLSLLFPQIRSGLFRCKNLRKIQLITMSLPWISTAQTTYKEKVHDKSVSG